ncbi:hypothetical protein V8C35DRAFT_190040 [Trichoderma chlorosporum]
MPSSLLRSWFGHSVFLSGCSFSTLSSTLLSYIITQLPFDTVLRPLLASLCCDTITTALLFINTRLSTSKRIHHTNRLSYASFKCFELSDRLSHMTTHLFDRTRAITILVVSHFR